MIFDFQRLGPDHHRTISQHNHMDEDEEGCKNGHDCACEAENLETRHVWNTVEYETHMNTQKWKFDPGIGVDSRGRRPGDVM